MHLKTKMLSAAALAALFAGIGCNSDPTPNEEAKAPGTTIRSEKLRNEAPDVAAEDRAALERGNSGFAFSIYGAAKGLNDNVFFSPHSLSSALAMVYAGARGDTASEIETALQFTLPAERLHPAFNALDLALASRASVEEGKELSLRVVNDVWTEQTSTFLPEYLDTLAVHYGAGLHGMDFINKAPEARKDINAWISEITHGLIPTVIPEAALTSNTRLVLTNAIYFKGKWSSPFAKSATVDGTFTTRSGAVRTVKMMSKLDGIPYARGTDFQLVRLPYRGDQIEAVALLPDAGSLDALEERLTVEELNAALLSASVKQVQLSMPKFQLDESLPATEVLNQLGMKTAFTEQADLSGMNGSGGLSISSVLHQAVLKVDEEGTEAAAATVVVVGTTSVPEVDVQLSLNRPFLFLIRDVSTGSILFMGRVADPKAL